MHYMASRLACRGDGPTVDGSISTDRSLASSNGEDVRCPGAPAELRAATSPETWK